MKFKLHIAYRFLLGVLIFSLPFEGQVRVLPNLILIVLLLMYPIIFGSGTLSRIKVKEYIPILGFILYVVLVSIIEYENFQGNVAFIGKIGLVLVVFFLFSDTGANKSLLMDFLMAGVALSILISSIIGVIYSVQHGDFSLSNGPDINRILITERPYLAFLCVFSFIFSLKKYLTGPRRFQFLYLLNLILVISFVFVIAARIAVLSIIFAATILLLSKLQNNRLRYIFIAGIVIIMVGAFLSPNMQKRIKVDSNKSLVENVQIWEPRVAIWSCCYQIFKSSDTNGLLGTKSVLKTRNKLHDCYTESIENKSKSEWFVKEEYNSHNQFLSVLLSFGVLGILIFVWMNLYPIILNPKNSMVWAIVMSMLLFGLVENYLERQLGAYVFFLFLFFTFPERKTHQQL